MFEQRHYTKELLDTENIPVADLYLNLRELGFINTWLGGHKITINGLKKIVGSLTTGILKVADVGCGGGDNLKALAKWARKKNINIEFMGIDMKQDCIDFAKQNCKDFPEISFIQSDYQLVDKKFDIIMSALFCHHLNDEQMSGYLYWCNAHSTKGFFVNDLQRHPFAYYSIKFFTAIFSKSYLVKNDAPLSVLRGFNRKEIRSFMDGTGITGYKIHWQWAFRYLVVKR